VAAAVREYTQHRLNIKVEGASAGNDREITKTTRRKMTLICWCAIHPLNVLTQRVVASEWLLTSPVLTAPSGL